LPAPIVGSFTSACSLLRAAALQAPDHEAFIEAGTDERLTYSEWDRQADAVARQLARMGLCRGDVVCFVLPSSIDYAVLYQAVMRIGAITSGINPRLGVRERSHILRKSGPKMVVVDPAVVDRSAVEEFCARTIDRSVVAEWRRASGDDSLQPDQSGGGTEFPELGEDDTVAIVWTSGTTGMPKGAVFDQGCLKAMAAAAGELTAPFDRKLSPLPFAHVGYMTRPWDEIQNLVTTVISAVPWKPDETLALLERERVTLCQGVPTQYDLLFRQANFDTFDFSSLRLVGMGAARIPPELVREAWERFGAPVIVRFASTESSVCSGTSLHDDVETIANTVGRPGLGIEISLRDGKGVEVPIGEVGTVWIKSRARMREYWREPELTAETLTADGWLLTGDLGTFDDRGVLRLVGRRTEMYIRGGYNVYPAELENVLGEHPKVARVAVVGVPTAVMGEMGIAFVVPSDPTDLADASGASGGQLVRVPGDALLDELRAFCRSQLADYKAPDRLVLVEDLPVTSMMKVDKMALAERWRQLNLSNPPK
jgi:acyl-CoA synthetase (AMP-forming)/AMP-acid ligase II